MSDWKTMDTAPKVEGQRILAWCRAAESDNGIVEMEWTGKYWTRVISDPWPNACLRPTHWRPTYAAPGAA